MRSFLFALFFFLGSTIVFGQTYWQSNKSNGKPAFTLQESVFAQVLQTMPEENVHRNVEDYAGKILLPSPEGEVKEYYLVSYTLQPADPKTGSAGQLGYHGFEKGETKNQVELMSGPNGIYAVFNRERLLFTFQAKRDGSYHFEEVKSGGFQCGLRENEIKSIVDEFSYAPYISIPQHHEYRIAVACTEEATQALGSVSGASSYIAQQVTGFNSFYRTELGITFSLVPGNDALITPINDGHQRYASPASVLPSSEPWFSENKENIENQGYSISDYDIGLLIAEIPPTMFAGGASEIGSACSDNIKASTWVGFQNASNPQNLTVGLHELGHKLGATHTFNSIPNTSSCIGERTSITAFEPGSGTTIMSYAGTCGFDQDIIAQRVLAFHTANLLQVSYYITTGLGSTCGTHTALFDTPPLFTFKGLDNLDIPFSSNLELAAKATDSQDDPILYAWDEIDLVPGPTPLPPTQGDGNAPCNTSRIMPAGSKSRNIISGTGTVNSVAVGGFIPSYERDLTFAVTIRSTHNGFGAFSTDKVQFQTKPISAPFSITYPSGLFQRFLVGSSIKVKWTNSNFAPPFSVAGVRILLSTDGGQSWPHDYGTSANDGEEMINLPYALTTDAMLRIEALDRPFFTLSEDPFSITETCHGYSNSTSATLQPSFISKVQFLNIINESVLVSGSESYTLYNQNIPNMVAGHVSDLHVTVTGEPQALGIWLDLNGDGKFDGEGEFLASTPNPILGTHSMKFAFPATIASEGIRALRIRSRASGLFSADDYCTAVYLGETEDYLINVTAGAKMYGYCRPFNNGDCGGDDCTMSIYPIGSFSGGKGYSGASLDMTPIVAGTTRTIEFSRNSSIGFNATITVDFNEDGDFTDANEVVYQSPSKANNHVAPILIPNLPEFLGQKRFRFWTYNSAHSEVSFDCSAPIAGTSHDLIIWINRPEPCALPSGNRDFTIERVVTNLHLSCCDVSSNSITVEDKYNIFLFGGLDSLMGGPGNTMMFPWLESNQLVERKYMLNRDFPSGEYYPTTLPFQRRTTLTQGVEIWANLKVNQEVRKIIPGSGGIYTAGYGADCNGPNGSYCDFISGEHDEYSVVEDVGHVGVFIDFNNDLDFNDVGEFVGTGSNFTLPINPAFEGQHILRILYTGGPSAPTVTAASACNQALLGNVFSYNDFYVDIVSPATAIQTDLQASTFCAGGSISISGSAAGSFGSQNEFTAQLSNANGSFASPTFLGTTTNLEAKSYTLPALLPPGSGYRVRLVSTHPVLTGSDNGTDFTIRQKPELTSVSPASGFAGNPVVISGSNLSGLSVVLFQDMQANFTLINSNEVSVVVPAGLPLGLCDIKLLGGVCEALADDAFTVVTGKTATPTISPNGGTFTALTSVSLDCQTPGSLIYYTTDNSTPSPGQAGTVQYTSSFQLNTNATVKALAKVPGLDDSDLASADFIINLNESVTPTFSPNGGSFPGPVSVSLSTSTPGAIIYYTTNGQIPVIGGLQTKIYSGPFVQGQTATLMACAKSAATNISGVRIANFNLAQEMVNTPTIIPGPGTYPTSPTITLSCATPDAQIYYTTNGNVPLVGTPNLFTRLYTEPFVLSTASTVRAMGVKAGFLNSQVAVANISIDQPGITSIPVITPNGGTFEGQTTVTLFCNTPGSSIYYTTNGNLPRFDVPNSFTKLYTGPFTLYGAATIKAVGVNPGSANSSPASANFVINNPAIVSAPTYNPSPGSYATAQTITLSTSTPGAQIFYALNGFVPRFDVPNSFTKTYTGPFVVSNSTTIRAVALKSGFQASAVPVGIYTIGPARRAFEDGEQEEPFHFESLDAEYESGDPKMILIPNPTSGKVRLQISNAETGGKITILNMLGQMVLFKETTKTDTEIDLSGQPSGMYLVRFQTDQFIHDQKLIKQ